MISLPLDSKIKKGDFIYITACGNSLLIEEVHTISKNNKKFIYNGIEECICHTSYSEAIENNTVKMMNQYGFPPIIPVWNQRNLYKRLSKK